MSSSATFEAVVFDKVSFAYDDHVILRDISFTIAKGSMTMLLGASGAGKSTVLKLILGLLRPDSVHIVLNVKRIDQVCYVVILLFLFFIVMFF
jgi:ABC-type Fe3+/spermidine/putrescine transport system ATPase subunit